jgi:hypothetical protein
MKEASYKSSNSVYFYLYKIFRIGKSMKTESRLLTNLERRWFGGRNGKPVIRYRISYGL